MFTNRKDDNNGFSMVELIVVIAIMVVLVAAVAPVFTKYVEGSRRATDMQNANSIARAVNNDVADGKITDTGDNYIEVVAGNPSDIPKDVVTKGHAVAPGKHFLYSYDAATNLPHVYIEDCKDSSGNLIDFADTEYVEKYKDTKEVPNGSWLSE